MAKRHIYGTKHPDVMIGASSSEDLFYGSSGADQMWGYGGVDTVTYATSWQGVYVDLAEGTGISGDAHGDTYYSIENAIGSQHGDNLVGNIGQNLLDGGAGNDGIQGHGGNDRLYGRDGDDLLVGSEGSDSLYGGAGNDSLSADRFDAIVDGGSGIDRLYLFQETGDAVLRLYDDGTGSFSIGTYQVSLVAIENVTSGDGDDELHGNALDNLLAGGEGNDHIIGGAGNDVLRGEEGDDVLDGGRGSDDLWGSIGSDTFVFDNSEDDAEHDRITSFNAGEDRIDLRATERFGDEDFDDLMDQANQVGNDVVIDFGDGTLTIRDVDIDNLSASNFIFCGCEPRPAVSSAAPLPEAFREALLDVELIDLHALEVVPRDDAEDAAAVDDGEVTEAPLAHHAQRVHRARAGGDGPRIGRHDVAEAGVL
jgi:Ca2+-binding RTX toxin-like protein